MVMGDMEMKVDLAVIGAGPGGYAAAFRAADLGMDVALIDPRKRPGGVCLHEGCIPSKTCLSLAELIEDAARAKKMGVHFAQPEIDVDGIRSWKKSVIDTMASGLASLCRKRGIQWITASARFIDSSTLQLYGGEVRRIRFKHCIIATGSAPIPFPEASFCGDGRIMSSREALALRDIPGRLLVVGGGYVGLELGFIYSALGSEVFLVEIENRLLPAVDADLIAPLQRKLEGMFARIDLGTRIAKLEEKEESVAVSLEHDGKQRDEQFDRVLVAMGRKVNTSELGLENTTVEMDSRGVIMVNDRQRTAEESILAVGDVCGDFMLAHTAMRQGRVAAEVVAGQRSVYDVRAVPAIVYTDPQIAWCGLTESQAKEKNMTVKIFKYPWKYSGRAQSMGAEEGLTKLVTEPESGRILGVGICGRDAEGLITEGVLAIEMGALAEDLALSLHAHPTLSETMGESAEIFLGSPTHLMPKNRS